MSKAIEERVQQLANWMHNYEQTVKATFKNLPKNQKKKYMEMAGGTTSINKFPCWVIEQMLKDCNVQLSSNWPEPSAEAKQQLVLRKRLSLVSPIAIADDNDDNDMNDDSDSDYDSQ